MEVESDVRTKSLLDVAVDGELTSSDTTDHEKTGTDTTEAATETELGADLDQTGDGSLSGKTLGLVDLGKHGIGGLGDDGGGETSDETGTKVNGGLGTGGSGLLVDERLVNLLANLLVDDELGHGVRNPE